ncbi:MAG: hypothetical protein ABS36_12515 [Acidobacteria bacterium SCN 69-37]|nr:MAG: hypothetical protein ABS36_12515 [Acidobacteria bacterium SCN 69-37]
MQLKAARLGRVWVAGFVAGRNSELDVSTETVRLLRAQLRAYVPAGTVEAEPLAVESEERLSDVAYWRRQGEEHGTPLIVTGSVKLLLAPPAIVQRGPRTIYIPTAGRVLEATVVLIDGHTGAALSIQRLPARMRHGIGRSSSSLSLFLQLVDRAIPDWLAAIASAPPVATDRESIQIKE